MAWGEKEDWRSGEVWLQEERKERRSEKVWPSGENEDCRSGEVWPQGEREEGRSEKVLPLGEQEEWVSEDVWPAWGAGAEVSSETDCVC